MKKALSPIIAMTLIGCLADSGSELEILRVPAPEDDCTFKAETKVRYSEGVFDPRGVGDFPPNYLLVVVVRNNLDASDSDNAKGVSGNVKPSANNAQMLGFDVCWAEVPAGSSESDHEFDCGDLPSKQKTFFASSGLIESGGGSALFSVDVLTEEHLQGMFGTAFKPTEIPDVGQLDESIVGDINGDGVLGNLYSWEPNDPTSATRAVEWGTFPASRTTRILIKMRGAATLQAGHPVRTGWFTFPIDLCVGCVSGGCGYLTQITCATTPATTGWKGLAPSVATACLPYQLASVACVNYSSCVELVP